MSVFSGGINAAATATHIDLLSFLCGHTTGERASLAERRRLNILTVIYSCAAIGIAFLASLVGGLVTLSNLVVGVCGGPLLGIFLLGMLTQRVGERACLGAIIVGPLFMLYYLVSQLLCPNGAVGSGNSTGMDLLPVCNNTNIFTWYLLRLNTWWSSVLAVMITFGTGAILSIFFANKQENRRKIKYLTVWQRKDKSIAVIDSHGSPRDEQFDMHSVKRQHLTENFLDKKNEKVYLHDVAANSR
jgi:Na+/proline symporter